jgi:SAM-dependent methyltransferase
MGRQCRTGGRYGVRVDARVRMRRFWDARAREQPWFYVDNRLAYDHPDLERFWAQGPSDLDALLEMAGVAIRADDVVVDIGCGVGRLTRAMASRAGHVYALDISARMLQLARRHNSHLDNVTWLQGDGAGLAGVPTAATDGCVSHVVFQHIPDPAITLSYVREMGRVLRPGGWAAFQLSTDAGVHRPPGLGVRLRGLLRRGPRGQGDPAWLGSAVAVDDLHAAAADGCLSVEHLENEASQFTVVRLRRR